MSSQKSPRIGFCGLGAMGGGMAMNLAKLGFVVHGYDLYKPLVDKLVEIGGHAAASPAAAASGADFLILMVINSAQVDTVHIPTLPLPGSEAHLDLSKNTRYTTFRS